MNWADFDVKRGRSLSPMKLSAIKNLPTFGELVASRRVLAPTSQSRTRWASPVRIVYTRKSKHRTDYDA